MEQSWPLLPKHLWSSALWDDATERLLSCPCRISRQVIMLRKMIFAKWARLTLPSSFLSKTLLPNPEVSIVKVDCGTMIQTRKLTPVTDSAKSSTEPMNSRPTSSIRNWCNPSSNPAAANKRRATNKTSRRHLSYGGLAEVVATHQATGLPKTGITWNWLQIVLSFLWHDH